MDNNLVDSMNKIEEPKEEKGFWDKITDRFKGGVDRLERAGVKDLARDTGKDVKDLTDSMNKELPEKEDKEEKLITEEEANKFFTEGTTPEEAEAIAKSSVGEEFENIEKATKELDKEDTPLEKGNPNNIFTSAFMGNVDPEKDSVDVMSDKVLSNWQAKVKEVESQFAKDKDKMQRDKMIVGLLLAAQAFANGMAVQGTGRVPAQVDTSILKDMEDSLTDDRDYKLKRAGLQLSNAKWLIGQHSAKKRAEILAGERQERKKDKEEYRKERNLYQVEKAAQSIEKDFSKQKQKFIKDIQNAGSESDKIAIIKRYFPKKTDKAIQNMVDAGIMSWEKTGAELATELEGEFDDRAQNKINRLYKAKGIKRDLYEEPSEESSPKEKSFPMDIFKDGKKATVKNAKELEEARSEGWETR